MPFDLCFVTSEWTIEHIVLIHWLIGLLIDDTNALKSKRALSQWRDTQQLISKSQVARAWEMGRGERAIIDYLKAV